MKLIIAIGAAVLAQFFCNHAIAQTNVQPYSMPSTQVRKFHSDKLARDYLIYLGLPREYSKASESYAVVFVLDADYCFPLVQDMAMFLADHDEMRPVIVVGIAYPGVADEKYGPILKLNRTRDYTPTRVLKGGYGPEFQTESGGADRFLDFISSELIPYLKQNFRVKDDRTIVGYSYGGLLASYAMLSRPSLFQRYIVVSPSLWYGDHYLLHLAVPKEVQGRAFFAAGGQEKDITRDLTSFLARLHMQNSPSLRCQSWVAERENHHSVFPAAAMRGIKNVFSTEHGTNKLTN